MPAPRVLALLARGATPLLHFWQVCPKETISRPSHPLSDRAREATA